MLVPWSSDHHCILWAVSLEHGYSSLMTDKSVQRAKDNGLESRKSHWRPFVNKLNLYVLENKLAICKRKAFFRPNYLLGSATALRTPEKSS
jgi:hypothetical protein